MTRRSFIKNSLRATAAAGIVYPVLVEPWRVSVETITVALARLPAAFEGFRIVQLSDLHFRPFTTLRQIEHVVEKVNALQPDLIAITGDFITREAGNIDELTPVLARLQARHGVTSVLGNHDQHHGTRRITEALRKAGIEVLRNEGRDLTHAGASIYLAGIDSICAGHPDLKAALGGKMNRQTALLLAHEPDTADFVPAAARVGLQLSGHSHGGQIRLPWLRAPLLPDMGRKYWIGLNKVKDLQVYTNRGIGTIFVPARLGSLPEITQITLAAQTSA